MKAALLGVFRRNCPKGKNKAVPKSDKLQQQANNPLKTAGGFILFIYSLGFHFCVSIHSPRRKSGPGKNRLFVRS
ncbi:unnamed protein product [Larinioides sclopetarius]|uniref:Uncharacterized protein n=1 Tax=Larinioides sclopetarius TaxID=280406 RepID=A0AAV2BND2_9ARAC